MLSTVENRRTETPWGLASVMSRSKIESGNHTGLTRTYICNDGVGDGVGCYVSGESILMFTFNHRRGH